MKRSTKIYFRTLYISLVIIMCLCLGVAGIGIAYENTVKIAFGEDKKAVEINDSKIRILDFEISIK